MRPLATGLLSKLADEGSEPVLIFEIDWTDDTTLVYSDKDLSTTTSAIETHGTVDVISDLSFEADFRGITESSQITLALFDTDNTLHDIMHTVDIHKRAVRVYLHEPTLAITIPYTDNLMFLGQINSPITWDEGTRRMEFSVLSELESAEVGFSIEEGQFPNAPENLIGKPWPLCFGTVKDVPALHAQSTVAGRLAGGTGLLDATLIKRLKLAINLICPKRIAAASIIHSRAGDFEDRSAAINASRAEKNRQLEEEVECQRRRCELVENLRLALEEQSKYVEETIKIYGGDKFPQGTEITLDIGGSYFTGSFDGTDTIPSTDFIVTSTTHKELIPFLDEDDPLEAYCADALAQKEEKISTCGNITVDPRDILGPVQARLTSRYTAGGSLHVFVDYVSASGSAIVADTNPIAITNLLDVVNQQYDRTVEASKASFEALSNTPSTGFFWARAGSPVLLVDTKESVHIANILPSEVHYVKAFRETDEGEEFVEIPQEYYTVRLSNFNSYEMTELVFDPPLSQRGQGWKDQIYVSLTSTIGPNPVDIMTYIIDKYTPNSMNSLANDIRGKFMAFPMHFCVDGRPDANSLLAEIAFHARCAISFRRGEYSLFFLAEEPTVAYTDSTSTALTTIAYSDIDAQSLVLDYTPTEDVVTKMDITWRDTYNGTDQRIILRHNISKYGVQEEQFDWNSYTIRETVKHTATFWLIRLAKVYRIIRFTTPPHLINLEPLDPVSLQVPDLGTDETITGIVLSSIYDPGSQRINWTVWTPILAGTTVPYRFAWPADLGVDDYWPTFDERAAGFAGGGFTPGFNVIPPSDHPLSETKTNTSSSAGAGGGGGGGNPCARGVRGFNIPSSEVFGNPACDDDQGDEQPSDTDKTAPDVELEEGDGGGIDIPDVPDPISIGSDAVGEANAQRDAAEVAAIKAQEDANRARRVAEEALLAAAGAGGAAGGGPDDPLAGEEDPIEDLADPDDLNCSYAGNFFTGTVTATTGGSSPGDSGKINSFTYLFKEVRHYGSLDALNDATILANKAFAEREDSTVGDVVETNASRIDIDEKEECGGNPPGLLAIDKTAYPPV